VVDRASSCAQALAKPADRKQALAPPRCAWATRAGMSSVPFSTTPELVPCDTAKMTVRPLCGSIRWRMRMILPVLYIVPPL